MRLAAALVLFWVSCAAHAQAILGAETVRVDLWPHVRVLSDPAGTLRADEVAGMHERFAPPAGAYATLGMARETVWLRVPLTVAGGDGVWIFDLDYTLLNSVDVHLLRDGRLAGHVKLGNEEPFASRPLQSRSHSAPLELAHGASELLVRVQTGGARILPMSLARLPAFHARALLEQLLQGALGCLALGLVLFSLAQWASLGESLYLKYALLALFSALFSVHFFGIGEMYLWTDSQWAQRHMAGVTALLAAGATALFVEDALAGDLSGWLRRGLHAVAALHGLAAVAHGLDWLDIRTVGVLMSTTGLAPALMGLPGAIAKARRGDTVGGWFLAAWLGYFIASAIMVGVVRGKVGADFWTMHSFQIGATFDMLVFMRIAVLRSTARHRDAQRAAQERDTLHSLAHSDPLTGLLNRRGLNEALGRALAAASPQRIVAVYMLDLDGFKAVNDRFGHDVGDELLLLVAQRLRGSVRADDGVARLGGDEFVVMADGLVDDAFAQELGEKLLAAFDAPFALSQHTCGVTSTIGYALAPADGVEPGALLKAADAAMYAGKEHGKNRLLRALAGAPARALA